MLSEHFLLLEKQLGKRRFMVGSHVLPPVDGCFFICQMRPPLVSIVRASDIHASRKTCENLPPTFFIRKYLFFPHSKTLLFLEINAKVKVAPTEKKTLPVLSRAHIWQTQVWGWNFCSGNMFFCASIYLHVRACLRKVFFERRWLTVKLKNQTVAQLPAPF